MDEIRECDIIFNSLRGNTPLYSRDMRLVVICKGPGKGAGIRLGLSAQCKHMARLESLARLLVAERSAEMAAGMGLTED